MVYGEWWTGEQQATTDSEGWATFSGAFFGNYSVEVAGANSVEFQLQASDNELAVEQDALLTWLSDYSFTEAGTLVFPVTTDSVDRNFFRLRISAP